MIGVGGLGHIAVQVLRRAVRDRDHRGRPQPAALELIERLGAHHLVNASEGDAVEQVLELTGGNGAEAVIDFVGEGTALSAVGRDAPEGGTTGWSATVAWSRCRRST